MLDDEGLDQESKDEILTAPLPKVEVRPWNEPPDGTEDIPESLFDGKGHLSGPTKK